MNFTRDLEVLLAHHVDFLYRWIGDNDFFVFGFNDYFSCSNVLLLDAHLAHHLLHFPRIHPWDHPKIAPPNWCKRRTIIITKMMSTMTAPGEISIFEDDSSKNLVSPPCPDGSEILLSFAM